MKLQPPEPPESPEPPVPDEPFEPPGDTLLGSGSHCLTDPERIIPRIVCGIFLSKPFEYRL